MRILCEKHVYEALEAYTYENKGKTYLCFRTDAPYARYRIEVPSEHDAGEIVMMLTREGYVNLDYYAKKTVVTKLEKFDDSTLYMEAMETFREAVEEKDEKLPPIWTDIPKKEADENG